VHPIAGQRLTDADKKAPHLHVRQESKNLKSSDGDIPELAFKDALTACLASDASCCLQERRGAVKTIPRQYFQEVTRQVKRFLTKRSWSWLCWL